MIAHVSFGLGNWQHLPMDWDGLIASITQFQGQKLSNNILCLSLAVSMYKIWEARNKVIHHDKRIPPRQVASEVVNIIKSRLSQVPTFIKATNHSSFYCNWLL